MEERKRKDLRINGLGQASGGTYGTIHADGIATLNGDIVCNSLVTNGTFKLKGSIQGGDLRINGTASVAESVNGETLRVDGMLKAGGNLRTVDVNINGMLTLEGNASGESMKIDGGMKLGGNAEFETLQVHGGFQIGGMLNAGALEIWMAANCKAKEIGGENIRVRSKPSARNLLALVSPSLAVRLIADSIEGDDVTLEKTTAEMVRGGSVRIGPGCRIGRVEYKHHYEAHPGASVGSAVQV